MKYSDETLQAMVKDFLGYPDEISWLEFKVNNDDPERIGKYAAGMAEKLREEWKVKYLLISLAEQGMALFTPDGKMTHIPTRAKEVFDVCGAGDTVISISTLALASNPEDPVSAAEIANYAAGLVVAKLGTASITPEELLDALK